jgi:hypothetical protein
MNATRSMLTTAVPALLALGLSGGCAAESPTLAGGVGDAPDVSAASQPLAGADDDHPCGSATLVDVAAQNGNRLQLCRYPSGVEAFIESGPTERASAVKTLAPARPACALEVLLATTSEDVPVPRALLTGCSDASLSDAATSTRQIVDAPVLSWVPDTHAHEARANYCGASGASSFQASECFHCDPYDDCADWCITALWGWHDRNFGGWMGQEGNVAMETTAACTGQVRVRAFYAEDTGDAWETKIDKVLNAGTSSTYGLIYHSVAIFGQDYDFRLRAESFSGGGVHRHSGYFLDE